MNEEAHVSNGVRKETEIPRAPLPPPLTPTHRWEHMPLLLRSVPAIWLRILQVLEVI